MVSYPQGTFALPRDLGYLLEGQVLEDPEFHQESGFLGKFSEDVAQRLACNSLFFHSPWVGEIPIFGEGLLPFRKPGLPQEMVPADRNQPGKEGAGGIELLQCSKGFGEGFLDQVVDLAWGNPKITEEPDERWKIPVHKAFEPFLVTTQGQGYQFGIRGRLLVHFIPRFKGLAMDAVLKKNTKIGYRMLQISLEIFPEG